MRPALLLLAVPLMLGAVACGGWLSVDGYDAEYVTTPAQIERYPRYAYRDTYVYEVQGRYYRRYGNRWIMYRTYPADLRGAHADQGRAETDRERERYRGRR